MEKRILSLSLKPRPLAATHLVFVFCALLSAPGLAAEYLIKYKSAPEAMLWSSHAISMSDVAIESHNPTAKLLKIDLPENKGVRAKILAKLLQEPNTEYIVPNFKLHSYTTPFEGQALKSQWHISKIRADKAWALAGKGSRKVVVAVIDTGADYNHESLKPNMIAGYNFRDKNNDPMDKTGFQNPGHGTHVSGIIGGTGLIDGGVVGISPEVAIMPLKFLGEDGSGDLNSAIAAIDYAIEKKVDIIQASWGATVTRSEAQPLVEAVKRADDAGIIFVVAAANDGANNDKTEVYPANAGWPNMISVGASGPNDEKPSWSNYGLAKVHLAAPGQDIMSSLPKNKYGNLSGTSMATPVVAGIVALLKSQDPKLSGEEARALLQATGAKTSIQVACNCRIDAAAAVETLINKKLFVAPNAMTLAPNATQKFHGVNGTAPFKFSVNKTDLASIEQDGTLKALAKGEVIVTMSDASGATASTLPIRIGDSSSGSDPGDGGGGQWPPIPGDPGKPGEPGNPGEPGYPGTPGECPLGDPSLCEILCQIQPDLPFCKK